MGAAAHRANAATPRETMIMTLADLDRLSPLPCMDVCPVCGSDQVHGRACIATRLFRTIKRLGERGIRRPEVAVVDRAFLKACGIEPQQRGERRDSPKQERRRKTISTFKA